MHVEAENAVIPRAGAEEVGWGSTPLPFGAGAERVSGARDTRRKYAGSSAATLASHVLCARPGGSGR